VGQSSKISQQGLGIPRKGGRRMDSLSIEEEGVDPAGCGGLDVLKAVVHHEHI